MSDDKKSLSERHAEHREENWDWNAHMKNWRSWGSWFSWGSPVGLGLFLVLTAVATWIFFHAAK
ncbi:MAG: hypothetical protein JWO07_48 [Candidatus Saccharibacteria bacterium]|nr:hypothetical protein [Candidatus Saccharibacteria bacterium]